MYKVDFKALQVIHDQLINSDWLISVTWKQQAHTRLLKRFIFFVVYFLMEPSPENVKFDIIYIRRGKSSWIVG